MRFNQRYVFDVVDEAVDDLRVQAAEARAWVWVHCCLQRARRASDLCLYLAPVLVQEPNQPVSPAVEHVVHLVAHWGLFPALQVSDHVGFFRVGFYVDPSRRASLM